MEMVGVKQLKENLSRYLKRVKAGERIMVTDRRKEVAMIVPCGQEPEEEKMLQLVQQGIAYWSGGKPTGISSRIVSKGKSVSDAILEDRR